MLQFRVSFYVYSYTNHTWEKISYLEELCISFESVPGHPQLQSALAEFTRSTDANLTEFCFFVDLQYGACLSPGMR